MMRKLILISSSIVLAFCTLGAFASTASEANVKLGKATVNTAPEKMEPKLEQLILDIIATNDVVFDYETTDFSDSDTDYRGVKSFSCGNTSAGLTVCGLEIGKGSGCAANHTVWAVLYHGVIPIDSYADITGGDLAPVHFEYAVCNGAVVQQGLTGGQGTASTSVTDCIADQSNPNVLTAAMGDKGVMQKAQNPDGFCGLYKATLMGTAS